MAQIIDRSGTRQEVNLSGDAGLELYREAASKNLSVRQLLNQRFETDPDTNGDVLDQLALSAGLFQRHDRASGVRPPTIAQVMSGEAGINMGALTRPDGSQALQPDGRVLFPAVIMEMMESELATENNSYVGTYNSMIAMTESSNSPRWEQPIINLTAPRAKRSRPIAQLAEPPAMVSITLSNKSYRIPSFSIGMEISDEAARASALDLVGIAMREQADYERVARVEEDFQAMVAGDADLGMTALTGENASVYDAAATGGAMTQKAWVKWLRKDYRKLTIDWVICDIDTYLAVEGRTGRPTWQSDRGTDERLNSLPFAVNPGLPDSVRFFIVDTSIFGANTLIGIDSRRAIRKVIYAGAAYSAIEQFVMRRSTALRIDFAEASYRLFDQAWKRLNLV